MYVYFISQMRIHLSYWGTQKKWCMEIGFYIFYICSLKHTFDIRVFVTHHKNLRKPAEIRHFLTNQFITVNLRVKVVKYLKSVKIPDSSIVYRFLVGLSYLGQRLMIVPLHNILFESILTLGAKLDNPRNMI